MNKTPMSAAQLLDAVEDALQRNQPEDYRIEMSREGVRNDGDWWYVVVHPTKPDVRASEYTRRLEQVENEIARSHGVDVLLVPTVTD